MNKKKVVLGVIFILSPTLIYAQIPAIKDIPQGLTAEQREELANKRSELVGKRDTLRIKIESHNQK